jgi:hypothetical protein
MVMIVMSECFTLEDLLSGVKYVGNFSRLRLLEFILKDATAGNACVNESGLRRFSSFRCLQVLKHLKASLSSNSNVGLESR